MVVVTKHEYRTHALARSPEKRQQHRKQRSEVVARGSVVLRRGDYPNGRLEPGPGGGEGGPGGLFVSGSIGLAASAAARHSTPSSRVLRTVDLSAAAEANRLTHYIKTESTQTAAIASTAESHPQPGVLAVVCD